MSPNSPLPSTSQFGPVHVIEPQSQHIYTIILLHGRGSTGPEFASELFEAKLSNDQTLPEHLPTVRWVFPLVPRALEAGGAFVESMAAGTKRVLTEQGGSEAGLLSIPVFLGHGTDDAYVDIELGRQAAQVVGKIGLRVKWREYTGADQEGHWLKEPEEFDDMASFIASSFALN
ncbi:hypothetical protein N0V88_005218 [Collariella sp. IMI 366227]|nr:hypothetical protein N0V88_005218 [Collariella sp. IMI 366227]